MSSAGSKKEIATIPCMRQKNERAARIAARLREARLNHPDHKILIEEIESYFKSNGPQELPATRYYSYERPEGYAVAPDWVLQTLADWWKPRGGIQFFKGTEDHPPYGSESSQKKEPAFEHSLHLKLSPIRTYQGQLVNDEVSGVIVKISVPMRIDRSDLLAVLISEGDESSTPRFAPSDKFVGRASTVAQPGTIVIIETEELLRLIAQFSPWEPEKFTDLRGNKISHTIRPPKITHIVVQLEKILGIDWTSTEFCWNGIPALMPQR